MNHFAPKALALSLLLTAAPTLADSSLPTGKSAAAWRARCSDSLQRALTAALAQPALEGLAIEKKEVVVGPGGSVVLHLLGSGDSGRHGPRRLGVDVQVTPRAAAGSPTDWTRTQGKMMYIPPHIHLERHARLFDATVEITQQVAIAGDDLERRFKLAVDECLR